MPIVGSFCTSRIWEIVWASGPTKPRFGGAGSSSFLTVFHHILCFNPSLTSSLNPSTNNLQTETPGVKEDNPKARRIYQLSSNPKVECSHYEVGFLWCQDWLTRIDIWGSPLGFLIKSNTIQNTHISIINVWYWNEIIQRSQRGFFLINLSSFIPISIANVGIIDMRESLFPFSSKRI